MRGLGRGSVPLLAVLVPAGFAVVWVRARTTSVDPLSVVERAELNGIATVLALALAVAWLLAGARWPRVLADVTVAGVATFAAGSLLLALRGTPWGIYGLFGDQAFRTEAVTRYTEATWSADYAYRGLPSHYPPLLPWLEGKAASLTGLEGWEMVKVGQVAVALVVPVLAYLLWKRIVPAPAAAAVVAVTTLFVGDPYKADQWVVLALAVPWWLDAFTDVRGATARAWPGWVHGIVAGLLLTTYTFYFVPLAVATVLVLVAVVVRRGDWLGLVRRWLVVVAVGLAVAAWYWLPMVLQRLSGTPADDLQMRWFAPKHADVPLPLDGTSWGLVPGALAAAGVVYLVAASRRRREAEGLLLLAAAGYAVIGVGLLLAVLNRPILAFKATEMVWHVMLAGGVLAMFAVARAVVRWYSRADADAPAVDGVRRGLVVAVAGVTLAGALHYVDTWATGAPVVTAHATPQPDGTVAPAGRGRGSAFFMPMQSAGSTSVTELRDALGDKAGPGSVVVTSRVDLLATTPIHLFTAWWSIYSNPFGQFEARTAFLERLAATSDPAEFTRMARENEFDAIDAFVLNRRRDTFVYRGRADNFPARTRPIVVEFDRDQFDPDDWTVVDFDQHVVVTAR